LPSGFITTSIVLSCLTYLVLAMLMSWVLTLGGLQRSEAAHPAAELGFFFTAVLILVVMIACCIFAVAALVTSSALPARTSSHPGGCMSPSPAAAPRSRAALRPGTRRRKVSVWKGADDSYALTTGAGDSILVTLRRAYAASLAMPSGAAGATFPVTVVPRAAPGGLSASLGNAAADCLAASCFLASSTLLMLGRRRRREENMPHCETQARTRKEQEIRGEPTVSINIAGNGVREAVGATELGFTSGFASASTASARRPRSGDKVGVAGFGCRSTSAATSTLGEAAAAAVDLMRSGGVGVLGTRALTNYA
jgi:hypothetical protein